MPQGTPYHAFIPPYPIRVDDFTHLSSPGVASSSNANTTFSQTANLYLLTHTHTDHLNGLAARSFAQPIVCSHDAKEMLLRHEVYIERSLRNADLRAENVRTFAHLKVTPQRMEDGRVVYLGSRDLLCAAHLHVPTTYELSNEEKVTITLLDANHCPGAVMFLVEGAKGAVLHTGDLRAEAWFLESLRHNPFIQRYIDADSTDLSATTVPEPIPILETIYLDTACLLNTYDVPPKADASEGLTSLMALYPSTTRFFLNVWTWGYEEIYKAVARKFHTKIHVDRYKHSVYSHVSGDPFLQSIITQDESSTRFHACERFERCEHVRVNGRETHTPSGHHVVYVNPVNMDIATWHKYLEETREQLISRNAVNILLVPLARHSPLPELRKFVSLFRPRRVVPNTLDPALQGLDAACIEAMFADCLFQNRSPSSGEGPPTIPSDLSVLNAALRRSTDVAADVAFKNLEGEGARDIADKWADSGRMQKKLLVMMDYLPSFHRRVVNQILHGRYAPASSRATAKIPKSLKPPRRQGSSTDTAPPSSPPQALIAQKRVFQGRASEKESRTAMSRLSSLSKIKVYQSSEMDSDTDQEGEDSHAMMATALWGDEGDISHSHIALNSDRSSSPLSDSIEPRATELSRAVRLPSQMPPTPRSKHGSQYSLWLRSSSSAPEEPSEPSTHPNRRRLTQSALETDDTDNPRTPRRTATLSSPCPSECSTARKGKDRMVAMPTPDTRTRRPPRALSKDRTTRPAPHFPALSHALPITSAYRRSNPTQISPPTLKSVPTTVPRDEESSPLSDLHNLGKRPSAVVDVNNSRSEEASQSPNPKRRRVGNEGALPRPRAVPSASASTEGHTSPFHPMRHDRTGPQPQSDPSVSTLGDAAVGCVVEAQVTGSGSSDSRSTAAPVEDVEMPAAIPVLSANTAIISSASASVVLSASASTSTNVMASRIRSSKGYSSVRQERLRVAERLARARPDLVVPSYKAKMQSRRAREEQRQDRDREPAEGFGESASTCMQVRQGHAQVPELNLKAVVSVSSKRAVGRSTSRVQVQFQQAKFKIPSRLPSQDEEMTADFAARSRQQSDAFKKRIAEGDRPGVVIPRLGCLESQVEEGDEQQ